MKQHPECPPEHDRFARCEDVYPEKPLTGWMFCACDCTWHLIEQLDAWNRPFHIQDCANCAIVAWEDELKRRARNGWTNQGINDAFANAKAWRQWKDSK